MKINFKISIVLLSVMLLMFSSCTDFLDVNDNPTKVKDANVAVLLPTAIERTSAAHYSAMLQTNQITHHLDNYFGYYAPFDATGLWEIGYLRSLNQLKDIYERSEDSPHYRGIARILQAVNLGLMTGFWENIPFSEAFLGSANTTPKYDSQESVYTTILSYLDEGIALLAEQNSFLKPGTDDLAYGGKLDKWTKLAYSLKARFLLHLSKKSNSNWQAIVDAASKGFASNADNFQLVYNDVNQNPLHQLAKANLTGNYTYTFSHMFINTLKDTRYGAADPRLEKLVTKGTAANYFGLTSFDKDAPANTVNIPVTSYYSLINSPVLMMSYSELKFIEAEAKLKLGGNANTPYAAGVAAHMALTGADGAAYMGHPDFALNGTNDLRKIMREKYIAMIYSPEFWNDMRRYDFDPNVFEGFVKVSKDNFPLATERTGPAHRALYPTSELNRNAANVTANYKASEVKMWKDN